MLSTELAFKVYEKSEKLEEFVPRFFWHFPNDVAEQRLRRVLEVSPFDAVKASATYSLLNTLEEQLENVEGEAPSAITEEMESLKKLLETKYVDATNTRGAKFSALIEAEEFAKRLEVGQPVPNIVGSDIDGVEFELHQYKDKVLVLSFWGFW